MCGLRRLATMALNNHKTRLYLYRITNSINLYKSCFFRFDTFMRIFKKIFNNKFFTAVFSFALGAGVMFFFLNKNPQVKNSLSPINLLNSLTSDKDDPDTDVVNPFAEIQKMQKELMEDFKEANGAGSSFETLQQKSIGATSHLYEITSSEDEKNFQYSIKLNSAKKEDLNISIENGQMTIKAVVEQKANHSQNNSTVISSFPLPETVDADKMEITNVNDSIIVKFPKTTAS